MVAAAARIATTAWLTEDAPLAAFATTWRWRGQDLEVHGQYVWLDMARKAHMTKLCDVQLFLLSNALQSSGLLAPKLGPFSGLQICFLRKLPP